MIENYLQTHYEEEITNLLNDPNNAMHVSLNVSLSSLQRTHLNLYTAIIANVHNETQRWNSALLNVQKSILDAGNVFFDSNYQIKEYCHVRFINLPQIGDHPKNRNLFPTNEHVGQLVQVRGSVIRMSKAKLLESKREYVCKHCKQSKVFEAEYAQMFSIEPPRCCWNTDTKCKGVPYPKSAQPQVEYCIDYQEIRIQELQSNKNIPSSLYVTLENDLVDSCQPGDYITICGTMEHRWQSMFPGKRSDVMLTLRAISVQRESKRAIIGQDFPEHLLVVRAEWQETVSKLGELNARDIILRSFCPDIHGMRLVKLAMALALSSGIDPIDGSVCNKRSMSHLLLVGDPGLAKSKLLKFSAAVATRAVHTTGLGCSAAGLTAAAFKDGGEWQLEAGALVLADNGVCCIDEFNLMQESDKASIHEAMEQQTISIAKAGLVCKLSTRCIVLAATNLKHQRSNRESNEPNNVNIGIASPLLSRFDLVLILRDEHNIDWDNLVAEHLLYQETNQPVVHARNDNIWSIDQMQTHFLAIRDIHPKLTPKADAIIGSYFKACRMDPMRDQSRTTIRLLDSLVRLSQAHARLLFRNEVNEMDAVTVIQLFESSYGFGRIVSPMNILNDDLSVISTNPHIKEVIHVLGLDEELLATAIDDHNIIDSQDELQHQSVRNFLTQDTVMNDENLEDILSLDDNDKTQTNNTKRKEMNTHDTSDLVKKIKRSHVNLNDSIHHIPDVDEIIDFDQYIFNKKQMENCDVKISIPVRQSSVTDDSPIESYTNVENIPTEPQSNPIKSPIFQNRKCGLSEDTVNKLNNFKNSNFREAPAIVQETKCKSGNETTNDSAYDTLAMSQRTTVSFLSSQEEQDFNCLDDLDI